jgi:hypothetical protein
MAAATRTKIATRTRTSARTMALVAASGPSTPSPGSATASTRRF